MAVFLTTFLVLWLMVFPAFSAQVVIPISITIESSLILGTVQGAKIAGVFDLGGRAETVSIDASGMEVVVAASEQDAINGANDILSTAILRRNGEEDAGASGYEVGYVIVELRQANVSIQVGVVDSPHLLTSASSSDTISVSEVTSNADQILNTDYGKTVYIPVFVGPILQIPENLSPGTYSGDVIVSVNVI